ncbi:alpha/beta fold hydrolase [Nocardia acidivorans]|uniref:alpha/beta fold hydrolase n=1 Tax=Nocardia acidivorans TaxID=404580 RepID=UPI00082A2A7D|nr:alpha/beta hydrolase [Nocardia acidivorans]
MPFVTTDDGAKIHFTDTGGAGPVLLLLHTIFMDADMWEGQRDLHPDYRIIAVDARGHGRTEDPGTPFDWWRLASDCWAVLDHLGIDTLVAGGVFQGGGIAMRMAVRQPRRIRGLILIGSSAKPYSGEERAGYRRILLETWVLGDGPLEELTEPISAQMIGGAREQRAPWLEKWAADRRRPEGAVRSLIERESTVDVVGGITVPALLMCGIGDATHGPAIQQELAGQLGGPTRIEVIDAPGACHAVPYTHPH